MFNQRVGRALDRPVTAERAQHAAHQRRLAGARSPCSVTIMPPRSARASAAPSARSRRHRQDGVCSVQHVTSLRRVTRASATVTHDARVDRLRAIWTALAPRIKAWGRELGSRRSASPTPISPRGSAAADWLARGRHGEMDYMARHGTTRARPAELVPGTRARDHRAHELSGRAARRRRERECSPIRARRTSSRYALGRDYHKVLRARLQQLADRIAARSATFGYRVFTDSAPVLEVALAREGRPRLARQAHAAADARGGLVFLPRRDLHRPAAAGRRRRPRRTAAPAALHRRLPDAARSSRPYELDARRCISYLTIELTGSDSRGAAPADRQPRLRLRRLPARLPVEQVRADARRSPTSRVRNGLDDATLVELFAWTRGGIRRAAWKAPRSGASATSAGCAISRSRSATRRARTPAIVAALRARADDPSALVREHVAWALARHRERADASRRSRGPRSGIAISVTRRFHAVRRSSISRPCWACESHAR